MHLGMLGGFQVGRLVFSLFGIPFVLIGLGMLSSPYWMRRRLLRTAYGITNRRVLIMSPGLFGSRTIHSVQPENILGVVRKDHADGHGSIYFQQMMIGIGESSTSNRTTHGGVGFHHIGRVKEVEALLRRELLDRKDQVEADG